MPEFGFPNKKPWTRSIGRTELFDPTYVPIVILDGGDPDFYTHANGKDSTNFGKVTFILKDNFFKFNVSFFFFFFLFFFFINFFFFFFKFFI